MAKTWVGSGSGRSKPVPWTVASMVSPGFAVRAQSLATPSCSANSRVKVPAPGSGSTKVYARWCGLPAPENHRRTHIVGWTPVTASIPPSVRCTRRYAPVTSSAPLTVNVKSFARSSRRTAPSQPCPCPMTFSPLAYDSLTRQT